MDDATLSQASSEYSACVDIEPRFTVSTVEVHGRVETVVFEEGGSNWNYESHDRATEVVAVANRLDVSEHGQGFVHWRAATLLAEMFGATWGEGDRQALVAAVRELDPTVA